MTFPICAVSFPFSRSTRNLTPTLAAIAKSACVRCCSLRTFLIYAPSFFSICYVHFLPIGKILQYDYLKINSFFPNGKKYILRNNFYCKIYRTVNFNFFKSISYSCIFNLIMRVYFNFLQLLICSNIAQKHSYFFIIKIAQLGNKSKKNFAFLRNFYFFIR